nr:unnamed protein product [Callosobruchus chinensis]
MIILKISSDASDSGWGIYYDKISSHGFWSSHQKNEHINYKELLALFFGLKCFAAKLTNVSILCRVDNTTAMSYVNKRGSVQFPKLNILARRIWQWCERLNLDIVASYIKSEDNREASLASRNCCKIETEWSLADWAFREIVNKWGDPEIDLCASRINKILMVPDVCAIDASTVDWRTFYLYALPPFAIISKTLKKIISDKANGILVVPYWVSQPWFPILQSVLIDEPNNPAPLSQQPFSDSMTIITKALLLGKVPQDSLEICYVLHNADYIEAV